MSAAPIAGITIDDDFKMTTAPAAIAAPPPRPAYAPAPVAAAAVQPWPAEVRGALTKSATVLVRPRTAMPDREKGEREYAAIERVIRTCSLHPEYTRVDLSECGINNELAKVVCSFISLHPHISHIDLSNNDLGVSGTKRLLRILESKGTVIELDIRRNKLSVGPELFSRVQKACARNISVQNRWRANWSRLAPMIAFTRANRAHPLVASIDQLIPLILQYDSAESTSYAQHASENKWKTIHIYKFMSSTFWKHQTLSLARQRRIAEQQRNNTAAPNSVVTDTTTVVDRKSNDTSASVAISIADAKTAAADGDASGDPDADANCGDDDSDASYRTPAWRDDEKTVRATKAEISGHAGLITIEVKGNEPPPAPTVQRFAPTKPAPPPLIPVNLPIVDPPLTAAEIEAADAAVAAVMALAAATESDEASTRLGPTPNYQGAKAWEYRSPAWAAAAAAVAESAAKKVVLGKWVPKSIAARKTEAGASRGKGDAWDADDEPAAASEGSAPIPIPAGSAAGKKPISQLSAQPKPNPFFWNTAKK